MKILVTYASAGTGHRKSAEAIYEYIKKHARGVDVSIMDVLQKTNPVYRFFYVSGYSFIISHGIWLWRLLFYVTYARKLRKPLRSGARVADRISTVSYVNYLRDENPDYIISTHFLASECAAFLKRESAITSKLFTVITDFGVHPFWISKGTDRYIVASETSKALLERFKIKPERISVDGIPIQEGFTQSYSKGDMRRKLGLAPDRFTVLLVTGSFGMGPLAEITDSLAGEVQVIVVCARNQSLYDELIAHRYPSVAVLGFVDNMPELMAAADMIITKPGGLTIAEILAMQLVPLFISPIPGQETQNIQVLGAYGIGRVCRTPEEVHMLVREYKRHPEKVHDVRVFMSALKKPHAAKGIWNAVCADSARSAGRRAV